MIEKEANPTPQRADRSRATMYGYLLMALIYISSAVIGVFVPSADAQNDNLRTFTEEELSQFNGKDGAPIYTAYDGIIYDVSDSPLFKEGEHFGHLAGKDLTTAMEGAPHAEEVFAGFDIVGKLGSKNATVAMVARTETRGRFLLLGKTMTAWSGYLFAIIFILNFMTCYVMPWCASSVPWKGKIPGPDKWDQSLVKLSYYHRYLAWATIVLGIIHGVLGIFQSFGILI